MGGQTIQFSLLQKAGILGILNNSEELPKYQKREIKKLWKTRDGDKSESATFKNGCKNGSTEYIIGSIKLKNLARYHLSTS